MFCQNPGIKILTRALLVISILNYINAVGTYLYCDWKMRQLSTYVCVLRQWILRIIIYVIIHIIQEKNRLNLYLLNFLSFEHLSRLNFSS